MYNVFEIGEIIVTLILMHHPPVFRPPSYWMKTLNFVTHIT